MGNYERSAEHLQQPAPRRRKKKSNSGCAGALLYLVIVVGISVILSIIAIFTVNDVLAFAKDDREIVFTIPSATTVSELSNQLDDAGVVNYGTLFKLFVTMTDKDVEVVAGTYTLNPSMDYAQIVSALRNEDRKTELKVTIPEGYTIAQIQETLIENGVCTASSLSKALNEYAFKHEFLADQLPPSDNWLEGYLFPDTYVFYQNADSVKGVVNKMLNNFDDKYDDVIKAGADELGMSMKEIVTIASLIEREARVEDEFAKISGVIYNRLNNSQYPRLEIDATVLYALGKTGGTLTSADLQVDHPYNTYQYEGLPPGPICNPGYNALYAASHPDQHDFYFYVAMPDGTHLFASTNDQHNANRATAQQAFEVAAANPTSDDPVDAFDDELEE